MTTASDPVLTRPKAIIFDWDNTLVDTWHTIHAALAETFVSMGHEPWTFEETRERVRYSMRESFPKLFGDAWEEAGRRFYQAFERLHIEHIAPLPGADAMVRELHAAGLCLAVGSNNREASTASESNC